MSSGLSDFFLSHRLDFEPTQSKKMCEMNMLSMLVGFRYAYIYIYRYTHSYDCIFAMHA